MLEGGFSVLTTKTIVDDVKDSDKATVLISELQGLSVSTGDLLRSGAPEDLQRNLEQLAKVKSGVEDLVSGSTEDEALDLIATVEAASNSYASNLQERNKRSNAVLDDVARLNVLVQETADKIQKDLSDADRVLNEESRKLAMAQTVVTKAKDLVILAQQLELAMLQYELKQTKNNNKKLVKANENLKAGLGDIWSLPLDDLTVTIVTGLNPIMENINKRITKLLGFEPVDGKLPPKAKSEMLQAKITSKKISKIVTNILKQQEKIINEAEQTVRKNEKLRNSLGRIYQSTVAVQSVIIRLSSNFFSYLSRPTQQEADAIMQALNTLQQTSLLLPKKLADELNPVVAAFRDNQSAFQTILASSEEERLNMVASSAQLTSMVSSIGRESVQGVISSGETAANIILVVTVIVIAFAVLLFIYAGNLLRTLTGGISRLARGDLDTDGESKDLNRSDELGELARAVKSFADKEEERRVMAAKSEAEQADRIARATKVESLIAGFRETAQGLLGQVSQEMDTMQKTATQMSSLATEASQQTTSAASASNEASASVQAVAAATEELSASISEISRQVGQTTKVVDATSGTTRDTSEKIGKLAEAAQKIGDVVNLIQDIAEQTNLLALNATIEAARAGEYGKGFAVVASEVKSLASQTGKATEEIAGQIAEIQGSTTEAVRAIQSIVEGMEQVNQATTAIAASVEEQGNATAEISANVNRASEGTQTASSSMGTVSNSVEQTSQASDEVQKSSRQVSAEAERLRQTVDGFLTEVTNA
ncbi:methyl-accepting chemotaxis protein [Kiloniella sp. b19]|uniref:methyl-accepting chemotaxis protein n=1 Tax=Kiloniella sp. GXU_MW_B19 TaxID=3141326 RepID=UPI0031CE1A00